MCRQMRLVMPHNAKEAPGSTRDEGHECKRFFYIKGQPNWHKKGKKDITFIARSYKRVSSIV